MKLPRALEVIAVLQIDADDILLGRASDDPIMLDDGQAPDPWEIDPQARAHDGAAPALLGCGGKDVGGGFQDSLHRRDDFALGIGGMPRKFGQLIRGLRHLFGAGIFQQTHAIEHQRQNED